MYQLLVTKRSLKTQNFPRCPRNITKLWFMSGWLKGYGKKQHPVIFCAVKLIYCAVQSKTSDTVELKRNWSIHLELHCKLCPIKFDFNCTSNNTWHIQLWPHIMQPFTATSWMVANIMVSTVTPVWQTSRWLPSMLTLWQWVTDEGRSSHPLIIIITH